MFKKYVSYPLTGISKTENLIFFEIMLIVRKSRVESFSFHLSEPR